MSYKGRHNWKNLKKNRQFGILGTVIASAATMETLWKKDLASGFGCYVDIIGQTGPVNFILMFSLETSGEEIKERNITIFGIFPAQSECRVGQMLME